MTPRAEVVTMNEAGKAAFLMDLKRAKTRHAYSLPDTAAVDEHVAAWEAKQAAIVEEMRTKHYVQTEGALCLTDEMLGEMYANRAAATFQSIRFYLGNLNRDVNEHRVEDYATAMRKGLWWFTPDPIVVTVEGNIINGQHRLLAVEGIEFEEGDVAPQFVVVWGVDKRAAILIDEARRSVIDRRDIAMRFAASLA